MAEHSEGMWLIGQPVLQIERFIISYTLTPLYLHGFLVKIICLTATCEMVVTVRSQRGMEKFACDGCLYVFGGLSEGDLSVKFWHHEKIGWCKARIHTRNGEVIKKISQHSHLPLTVKFVTGIKPWAEETAEGATEVICSCMCNLGSCYNSEKRNFTKNPNLSDKGEVN